MPKERIGNGSIDDSANVVIVWNAEGDWLQIATIPPSEENKGEKGYYVDLDLDSLNKIIATLKRARRKVYFS